MEKALRFYTEVLGFRKKHDVPVGEYRWITVTSPEGPDDVVAFTREPSPAGPVTIAVFADTCGNLIQLYQPRR